VGCDLLYMGSRASTVVFKHYMGRQIVFRWPLLLADLLVEVLIIRGLMSVSKNLLFVGFPMIICEFS
jgi:hypothetical protein